jgi:tyrosyl-tRNA synthetase
VHEPDLLADSPELRAQHELLAAGAEAILPEGSLAEKLLLAKRERRPLRVKLGIDPSGAELTLGHAVVLQKLRQFQDAGHIAVLIVGDFTGRIGDPTGKNSTRRMLTAEEIDANASTYLEQAMLILSRERVEIRHNSEWLGTMAVGDFVSYASAITVSQLLERDDFSRRHKDGTPISLTEFVYPVCQGIDSVAVKADLELGGTDQTFNNLLGRDVQRQVGQVPQAVLTMPILVGIDGTEKMGKSLGNWIGVREPGEEQFGKLMSIPDRLIMHYAVLCMRATPAELSALSDLTSSNPAAAKRQLAAAVVDLYHGSGAGKEASDRFDAVFKHHEAPPDVLVSVVAPPAEGDEVFLPQLLVDVGLAESRSDARRLIDSGGIRIDGERADAYSIPWASVNGRVIQRGKRRAVRIAEG